jgi:Protein phosphatase 2C
MSAERNSASWCASALCRAPAVILAAADLDRSRRQVAVLLDGAAPQHPAAVSTLANDAVWLVRRFVEVFRGERERNGASGDIAEQAESARLQLGQEYRALWTAAGFQPAEAPFACLGIAQEAGSQLELLNMGDLTTLLCRKNGTVERFGDSAVRELDRQALAFLRREIASGPATHAARVTNVWPKIQSHRALRNRVEGYDVLDPSVPCLGRMQRLSLERTSIRSFLMLSDGLCRLVDTYQRYTDAALFRAVESHGLRSLLGELRALELEDSECLRYPRFKQYDDATALWIQ